MLADSSRTQYIKTLEDRLKRTETLLRAAGILDDSAVGQEELHDDEGEELESDSEGENEEDEMAASPNLPRNQDGQPSKSRNPSISASAKPFQNIDSSTSSDIPGRSHSSPCKSDLQQIPLFKLDSREESRYYGRSILPRSVIGR